MPPKRKSDPKQHSLEEVAQKPVTKKRTKKGDLTHPDVEQAQDSTEDLRKRKLARKHQGDPTFEEKPKKQQKNASNKGDGKTESDNEGEGASKEPSRAYSDEPIVINRAPVLTLWVSAVAQREGYSRTSGNTFGKAIAGILAQSKGRSIGVYEQKGADNPEAKKEQDEKDKEAGIERIEVFGMTIKAVKTNGEYRATESGSTNAMDAKKVEAYLKRAFGNRLSDGETAFKQLAESFSKEAIGNEAYHLYEQFRPNIPAGQQGWGKKGELDLKGLKELHSS